MTKSPRILVADDEITQRMLTAEVLRNEGFEVIEAEDGLEAVAAFEREAPDLAILDVMMPGLDGFHVCQRIRRHRDIDRASTPVLMATGLEDEQSIATAFEVGATSFIQKPIQWSLLGHHARYLLRTANIEAELRHAKAKVEEHSLVKSQMFATLCHELRTPLNGVIGFADAIRSEMLGPIGEKGYLDFARDQVTEPTVSVDVVALLQSVGSAFRHDQVEVDAADEVLLIRGRVEGLRRAFGNVVANALQDRVPMIVLTGCVFVVINIAGCRRLRFEGPKILTQANPRFVHGDRVWVPDVTAFPS